MIEVKGLPKSIKPVEFGKYKDVKLYCKFNQKSKISNKLYFEKTHNDKLNFILNQICLISENLPIQEIFEHTVLKVVQNLPQMLQMYLFGELEISGSMQEHLTLHNWLSTLGLRQMLER